MDGLNIIGKDYFGGIMVYYVYGLLDNDWLIFDMVMVEYLDL